MNDWREDVATSRRAPVMGAVLATFVPWKMRQLSFSQQADDSARRSTTEILDLFLKGASISFAGKSALEARSAESAIPWSRRPFFWEGQSFGAAAHHACSLSRGNPSARYHAPGFRFMFFTGVGFWNGVAAKHLLPRLSLDESAWDDVADFHGTRPLVAGGLSFAVSGLRGALDKKQLDRLAAGGDAWWRRGVYQGAGRAAWFLYMRDLPRCGRLLEEIGGDDAEHVAEGLGLAITYTQLGAPQEIVTQLERLPSSFRRPARRGSRVCLAAAVADDPRIGSAIAELPEPLVTWQREGTQALDHAGRGPKMPERLAAALADMA